MKKLLLLLAITGLASSLAFAKCDEEKVKGNGKVVSKERSLASFTKINTGGSIDLIIDQNGKEAATVETDENLHDYIITEVKDGALNIHVKEHINLSSTKLVIHISCKELESVNSGGSGDIKTASKITGDEFKISHGGSGDFNLTLAVKRLKISTAGSGDYVLKGSADEFTLSAAGSGDIHASELACENAKISTAGSGDVHLKKGTAAKISSVGSGDVMYE